MKALTIIVFLTLAALKGFDVLAEQVKVTDVAQKIENHHQQVEQAGK